MSTLRVLPGVAFVLLAVLAACRPATEDVPAPTLSEVLADEGRPVESALPEPRLLSVISPADQGLPPELRQLERRWTGDFDGMRERRIVRVLTVFASGFYFLDGAEQRGLTYDLVKLFEADLNRRLATGRLPIHVLIIPVLRDQLLPALIDGYGDIAAANLTVTPKRLEQVDFSEPLWTDVDEVVVTGPTAPPLDTLDDLSGLEIFVRPSSSYQESLDRLNATFQARGEPEVRLRRADAYLEDEDLLEMVNAGLLPMVVVDSHKAQFWARVFDRLTVRSDLAVNTGGRIAWAVRRNSPRLRAVINDFVAAHREGSRLGNIVLDRYLRNTDWVENALRDVDRPRFEQAVELFRQYATEYGFDWLLIAAQGYQESRLNQNVRSDAGAVGVMQLLPSTAADPNVGIPHIDRLDDNIHAGVKYLAFLRDRYFSDHDIDPLDQTLFAMAAYNAGPRRIVRIRREAAERGLDPDRWFNNVELVAARRIGRETVRYVGNVYKYYVAYRLIANRFLEEDGRASQPGAAADATGVPGSHRRAGGRPGPA